MTPRMPQTAQSLFAEPPYQAFSAQQWQPQSSLLVADHITWLLQPLVTNACVTHSSGVAKLVPRSAASAPHNWPSNSSSTTAVSWPMVRTSRFENFVP